MALQSDPRHAQIETFLLQAGWADAARRPLGQDASTRRYERLIRPSGETAMLMDVPPVEDAPCPPDADDERRNLMGWNAQTRLAASRVDAFAALSGYLSARGLSTPEIHAHDSKAGLALIEDFGEDREFARLIERGEETELGLYTDAAKTLAHLHTMPAPANVSGYGECWPILDFDRLALKTNADLFVEWLPQFEPCMTLPADRAITRWEQARDELIEQALGFPRELTLRDYHAENLLSLPGRQGIARTGLLDFQDAVNGWDAWDMAMLVQDARRCVSAETSEAAICTYLELTGKTRTDFDTRLAVLGTLNALRITGLFARLVKRDDKPRYRGFMPRQQALLARNLTHPATAHMSAFIGEIAPFILEASA